MRPTRPVEKLEEMEGLDPIAEQIGTAASKVFKPRWLKDLLSGTWMGHPLHPVLTDIPIGFWTSAFMLDLAGGERSRAAADRLVGMGVVTALPTAVTGLSDFVDTDGKERRIGLLHATGNVSAVGLYALSFLSRRAGRRRAGLALSLLGASAATVAGYLGGHLSFAKAVGVNQAAMQDRPADWTPVIRADALAEGKPVQARSGSAEILLYRDNGKIFALADRCTHRGGPLHDGSVEDGRVACPWHASIFELESGDVVRGPATIPQPTYETREREGVIEVRARD